MIQRAARATSTVLRTVADVIDAFLVEPFPTEPVDPQPAELDTWPPPPADEQGPVTAEGRSMLAPRVPRVVNGPADESELVGSLKHRAAQRTR